MQDALEARVEALEIALSLHVAKTYRVACYIADWADDEWIGFMQGYAGELRRTGPEHIGVIVDRLMERLVPGDREGVPPGTARRAGTGEIGAEGK